MSGDGVQPSAQPQDHFDLLLNSWTSSRVGGRGPEAGYTTYDLFLIMASRLVGDPATAHVINTGIAR
eukprot:CAMPEP_0117664336 /NCGR_PEP_ID=MMETSP0804-20121206/9159_1 /TAXON_ID=1074897 /ORGANISM="Tetraselmis astigmatica, Strain CCMP880" /LENGTH=66 /DNA_ID=CAMNT_0005471549 /DNA_START=430 /DNA_END=630 /DNA_ORIENTATION=-